MRAIIYEKYGPPEVLQLREVAIPEIGKKDVLIKIRATAITKGDCELRSPEFINAVWVIVRLFFGLRKPRKQILGSYLSGVIEKVGTEVSRIAPGDEVYGISGMDFGAYAEYIRLPEKAVFSKKPKNITFAEAAPIGLALDSQHFIDKLKLLPGQTLLINGAGGGIGTYALQLAKNMNVHVTTVDDGGKSELLTKMGADDFIDYTKFPLSQHKLTYDAIFDVVGTIGHKSSLRLLKEGGKYVSAIPEFDRIFMSMYSNMMSSKKVMTGLTSPTISDLEKLTAKVENGQLRTYIDRKFDMESVVEAHRYIESGQKAANAVLIP